jgi:itaconate CoA-transferase
MPDEGALQGILVVALEQAVAGPFCTLRLADAGARVIKIERPEGDLARHYDTIADGDSASFYWLNRGKESIVLDLKAKAGSTALRQLLKRADVFVHNLAPGAVERLGFGQKVLEAEFPHLISARITGYGSDTPMADAKAYDMLIQAESGLCAITGTPDEPCKTGVSIADLVAGMNAHALILEALVARRDTGRGRHFEVALFDGMADFMAFPLALYERTGVEQKRYGLAHGAIYPYRSIACSDGDIIIAVQNAREWAHLCSDLLGQPDLANDPRFATNELRVRNRDALDAILEPAFLKMTCADARTKLEAAAIAFARRADISDFASHPALRRIETPLSTGGALSLPTPAGRANLTARQAPALGADTARVLNELNTENEEA